MLFVLKTNFIAALIVFITTSLILIITLLVVKDMNKNTVEDNYIKTSI